MALIALAVYDTDENGRTPLTVQTLNSLTRTVDWTKHRLIISDNGSCEATQEVYRSSYVNNPNWKLIFNHGNIGTAAAINKAWRYRNIEEVAVKMDNDVVIGQAGWLDTIEDVFKRDPLIGICGLKRKDLEESPNNSNSWYVSRLRMLPHEPGQRWLVVEDVQHVMGTCQAYSPGLLTTIGYLYQMQDEGNVYGFDDSLASLRAHIAGFSTCFLCNVDIDHIDPGGTPDTEQKRIAAGRWLRRYQEVKKEYESGKRPLWWEDK